MPRLPPVTSAVGAVESVVICTPPEGETDRFPPTVNRSVSCQPGGNLHSVTTPRRPPAGRGGRAVLPGRRRHRRRRAVQGGRGVQALDVPAVRQQGRADRGEPGPARTGATDAVLRPAGRRGTPRERILHVFERAGRRWPRQPTYRGCPYGRHRDRAEGRHPPGQRRGPPPQAVPDRLLRRRGEVRRARRTPTRWPRS